MKYAIKLLEEKINEIVPAQHHALDCDNEEDYELMEVRYNELVLAVEVLKEIDKKKSIQNKLNNNNF